MVVVAKTRVKLTPRVGQAVTLTFGLALSHPFLEMLQHGHFCYMHPIPLASTRNIVVIALEIVLFSPTDIKNAFEIVDREQPKATFTCKTEEEKNEWMSGLMTIYMRR